MMFPGTDVFARIPFHAAHTVLESEQEQLDFDSRRLQSIVKEKSLLISEKGVLADKCKFASPLPKNIGVWFKDHFVSYVQSLLCGSFMCAASGSEEESTCVSALTTNATSLCTLSSSSSSSSPWTIRLPLPAPPLVVCYSHPTPLVCSRPRACPAVTYFCNFIAFQGQSFASVETAVLSTERVCLQSKSWE
ncbi:uncharacterized protein Pyn_22950 [Prunus yedoensis var. nudiflora]|uniref:Uncharacterized protein n=1 Tax=Prunus yedoensis var. nudiflora TaxID=2094558 RepID=A0A314UQ99_PRUYE|nr:uncharacterized protein Pyn_22950 [Prunus yedoensis var. nudiflora]